MKSSFKGKGHNYTCTVEIDITPENQKQKNSSSAKQTIKSGLFHKKINSANNRYSKMKENINLNCTSESTTQSKNSLNTPEIGVQYKLRLEKLNTNILNLKNKYKDLIKENFETNNKIDTFKMRFLQLKKIELIFVIFIVFHFEISGNIFKEEQPLNIPSIFFILMIFHLEISGKDNKDMQL